MRIPTYTLFRRGSVYYAKKVYQGTVYTVTTGTKQLTQAQLLAPKLLAERIKGSERQLTVSQLLDMHLNYAVHLRPKTLKMIGQFTRMYLNELGVEPSVSAPNQLVSSFIHEPRRFCGLDTLKPQSLPTQPYAWSKASSRQECWSAMETSQRRYYCSKRLGLFQCVTHNTRSQTRKRPWLAS